MTSEIRRHPMQPVERFTDELRSGQGTKTPPNLPFARGGVRGSPGSRLASPPCKGGVGGGRPIGPRRDATQALAARTASLVIPLLVLLAWVRPAWGDGAPETSGAVVLPAPGADVTVLSALIDRRLAAGWEEAGVEPAAPAGDAEFLRRVSLDIAGRIPAVAEARAFLDDPALRKRRALVERLLTGQGYVNHFTDVWTKVLLPNVADELEVQIYAPNFRAWLRRQVAENVAYDALTRAILTSPVGEGRGLSLFPYEAKARPSPLAFYVSNDGKPENLAASTARVFLGIRLECAQCHDHPTANWKRDQFWSLAAFFAGIERRRETNCDLYQYREVPGRRELAISGGPRMVQARHLDGTAPGGELRTRLGPRGPGGLGRRARQPLLRPRGGQPGLGPVLRDRPG